MRRRAKVATLLAVVIKQGEVTMRVVMCKRSIRQWWAVLGVGVSMVASWAGVAVAAPVAPPVAPPVAGSCRVSLPFTSSAPQRDHPAVRAFASGIGSASCSGRLGPWLMGGQAGWSTADGAFSVPGNARSRRAGSDVAGGDGHLFAMVPRFAWFHPSMVTFVSAFRLRLSGGVLRLSGSARLVPTFKSPLAGSFRITGVGAITLKPGSSRARGRRHGVLVLRFAVISGAASPDRAG
jgi:hypothetical protein